MAKQQAVIGRLPGRCRGDGVLSQFVDRLLFFKKYKGTFAGGHGVTTDENRAWEDNYRSRWQSEKIVRSTHGVNCTGSCSWKIYVKNGLVTWETQQTDYPRTRPDLPNHEPRGCPRGASYSWYLYSSNRIKYPLVRGRLLAMWREARKTLPPVEAWKSIQDDEAVRHDYQRVRGLGGFVRVDWDEINELIAAANIHTIKRWGPDRVVGFSPIPAMSMISYAAGTRYLSLIGGTCLSFYDWYCDLPPSSPQTFGEQTDVPESADWYNSGYLLLWGSNVSMTRTPDAHFYTEARYRGAKSVVIAPDFIEVARFADLWLHPKQGTDAALALAMAHVILKEFFVDRQVPYFQDYVRKYSDLPFLVMLEARGKELVPGRMLRAADFPGGLGQENNPDWKPVVIDDASGEVVAPQGTAGFRWGEQGKWNLRTEGWQRRSRHLAPPLAAGRGGRHRLLPVFRQRGPFRPDRPRADPAPPGAGAHAGAQGRRPGPGRDRVRSDARQLRRRPRPRRRSGSQLRRRRARHARLAGARSPACRAIAASRSRGVSRPTPRRPTAGPWSSSGQG